MNDGAAAFSDWYQREVVDAGREPALWALIGFVVTFGLVRALTWRIRAREGEQRIRGRLFGDVYIGGVHVHHQVWGIAIVLVTGLCLIRFQPTGWWAIVGAVLFGVGAALLLDEFALFVYLDDVYWTDEGRKSIDAVVVAIGVGTALLIGSSTIDLPERELDERLAWLTAALVVVHTGVSIVCLLKGKLFTALVGYFVPFVGLVGAIRLAKPNSFWAKRFYRDDRLQRAVERFSDDHVAPPGPEPMGDEQLPSASSR